MGFAFQNMRRRGTGEICKPRPNRPGRLAYAPQVAKKRGVCLGHFDTYRQAEKALEAFLAGKKVA